MPFINSVISWRCPLLSSAVLICLNYLLIESINKSNWIKHVSISILAIIAVDYYHRLTLVKGTCAKYLRRLPLVVHGSYCDGEQSCQDFIGSIPFLFYSFIRSTGRICSYFIPDAILVHVVVIILAIAGLLIEQYISFVNVLVLCTNLLIVAGGLHRLDLLKYFLVPLLYIHNTCNSYLESVADSANQLEDNFVKELTSSSAMNVTTNNNNLLTAAMAEMYLPNAALYDAETDDEDENKQSQQKSVNQRTYLSIPDHEDDSDCDSILINRSRMPSPSRSYSSVEDLAPGNLDDQLLFSDEDVKTEHSSRLTPLNASGDFKRGTKNINLPSNLQRLKPKVAYESNSTRSSSDDFEMVNRDCFADAPSTLPTSQQVDSQGPYVYYYNTRARSKRN